MSLNAGTAIQDSRLITQLGRYAREFVKIVAVLIVQIVQQYVKNVWMDM